MFAFFLADLKLSLFQYLEDDSVCRDTMKEREVRPLSRPHLRTTFRTPFAGRSILPLRLWKRL